MKPDKARELIRARQRRAIKQVNRYGLDVETVLSGEFGVWPPSAAQDLKSLRLPPQQ